MLALRVALLATVAVFGTRAQSNTCDSVLLNKCLTDVFGDGEFGLNMTTNLTVLANVMKDYTILNNWFLSQWAKNDGVDTIVRNCNGLTNLYHCLGGAYCFSIQNMLQDTTLTRWEAYAVRGVFAEYNFNCNAGLGSMLAGNIHCIQNTIAESQEYLKTCTSTYLNNVKHDEPRACNYVRELTQCYSSPFHLAQCRREQDLDHWWACTSQKEFSVPQFDFCAKDVECEEKAPIPPPGPLPAPARNRDGSYTLRTPDVLSRADDGTMQRDKGRSFTLRI